ncbi:ABC transporter ATP-binding protein/permease [Anaerocolumna aminovalerica]|uniref:ABC transporter ATP-binding protein n=1 Tax=Anaerocolumna aminovalerica TaxID=1527 RepID=UPI001C0EA81E|nr:ABC transporter ATP-binding protein [Anaerocolumna aminovalerica]MBU5331795.1 ABC transporter ATP-binding protein/permease [Anaerocolumna aminovalerica]
MIKIKAIKNNFIEYTDALFYCMKLSWNASKYYTTFRIICGIVLPILGIANAFLGKYLINLFTGSIVVQNRYSVCLFLLVSIFIIGFLHRGGSTLEQYMQTMHDNILNEKLAVMIMDCSAKADLEHFDNTVYYDKLQAAARDSFSMIHIMWNALMFLSAAISFIGIFAVLWLTNPLFGILLTIAAIPSTAMSIKYTKSVYQLSIEQLKNERKKGYFQGIMLDKRYSQDVRLFNIGEFLKEKHYFMWKELFGKQRKVARRRTVAVILWGCIPETISMMIGINIGFKIFKGISTVGDYSLYTGLIVQFLTSCSRLSLSFTNIYDNKLRIINLKSIFELENHILNHGKLDLEKVDTIEFEHVSFAYPNTDKWILEDVSFCLSRHEKTAFIGINGSGKTTLIKLILRMYDPKVGTIKINGIDLKEYRLESLRANFSVYFQEMSNYCLSIFENVTISDIELKNKEDTVLNALKESCCEDILEKAPNGLSNSLTRIFDEDGVELSGGQHQKLALARVLYRRNTALILDEPSSNLDPKAEHDIFKNLKTITDGKMTIFTSHRLSNISLADRIIVLEKGKIVEDGSQMQLLKNNELYAELYRYQQEKFRLDEEADGGIKC